MRRERHTKRITQVTYGSEDQQELGAASERNSMRSFILPRRRLTYELIKIGQVAAN